MHFNLQYVRYVISLDIVNVHSWHSGLTLEDHLLPASNHSRVIHNSFVISRIKFADNAAHHSAVSPFFRAEGNLESTCARSDGNAGRQTDGEKAASTTTDGQLAEIIFCAVRAHSKCDFRIYSNVGARQVY